MSGRARTATPRSWATDAAVPRPRRTQRLRWPYVRGKPRVLVFWPVSEGIPNCPPPPRPPPPPPPPILQSPHQPSLSHFHLTFHPPPPSITPPLSYPISTPLHQRPDSPHKSSRDDLLRPRISQPRRRCDATVKKTAGLKSRRGIRKPARVPRKKGMTVTGQLPCATQPGTARIHGAGESQDAPPPPPSSPSPSFLVPSPYLAYVSIHAHYGPAFEAQSSS